MKELKTLLIKTFIFSIVLGIITVGLKHTDMSSIIHDQWYFIILFYFVLTGFIFYTLLKLLQKEPRKFVFSFLTKSVLRMLAFTVIILVYAFAIRQNAVSFILTFTAYYLLFTTWEIILIVPIIKNKKSNSH